MKSLSETFRSGDAGPTLAVIVMAHRNERPMTVAALSQQLTDLGVRRGSVLVVHTAFSKVGSVERGPHGLIAALQAAVGPEGTLVMPSLSQDDDAVFDPPTTPCRWMGIVADTFWRIPGVLRSDSPHAFAARGAHAESITAPHPPFPPHGHQSPVGRVFDLDGQVLLIGVGHDCNTTIHLAESLASVPYGLSTYVTVVQDGRVQRVHYREADHCCEGFSQLDAWLDKRGKQVTGQVGLATARLADSRDIVECSLERLREDPTVFLHPRGHDAECDAARASMDHQSEVKRDE